MLSDRRTAVFAYVSHSINCRQCTQAADLQFLIDQGADLDLGRCTPMVLAAQDNRLQIAQMLVQGGASINKETTRAKQDFTDTALMVAVKAGHLDMSKLLYSKGAALTGGTGDSRTQPWWLLLGTNRQRSLIG